MTSESDLARRILDTLPPLMRMVRAEIRQAANSEFTIPQLRILAHLYRGVQTATELAELQGCRPPVITKMVDSLAARDLIKRKPNPKNRRQITLSLTKKGLESFRRARTAGQAKIKAMIEKLSPEQRVMISSGLDAFDALLAVHAVESKRD